jgi:hypothetical protein
MPDHSVRPADCIRRDLHILKEAVANPTLGRRPLTTWVFVASITDEFILGLDVLRAHDASLGLRRHVLHLDDKEIPLWRLRANPVILLYEGNSEVLATSYGRTTAGSTLVVGGQPLRDGCQGLPSS